MTRLHVLAAVGLAVGLSVSLAARGAPGSSASLPLRDGQGVFQFPDTAAGRAAGAYVGAFNSRNDERMKGFLRDYRALSFLAERPVEERIDQYHRLRDTFGTLTPLRVALSLDLQVTFVAKGSNVKGLLVFRLQVDEAGPHRIALLTTSSVGSTELTEDELLRRATEYEAVRVADRAQPVAGSFIEDTARAVASILDQKYVNPAVGKAMAEAILLRLAAGGYADARRAGELADALTADAAAVSADRHIWVEATNPLQPQTTYAENRPVEELRRENYHFRKVEVLPANIGYLKFDMIHDDEEAQAIATRALASVKDCDALVFDLRDNIGGEFESGRLILSSVLPEGTILSRMYDRAGRLVSTHATIAQPPSGRFEAAVPVYILTSRRTGSAAEGFAYALQQSGRGRVVGETTAGMAHPSEEMTVNPRFLISVPVYRVESAFTKKSFEGVGITPDIRVPEQEALSAALKDAKTRKRGPRTTPQA